MVGSRLLWLTTTFRSRKITNQLFHTPKIKSCGQCFLRKLGQNFTAAMLGLRVACRHSQQAICWEHQPLVLTIRRRQKMPMLSGNGWRSLTRESTWWWLPVKDKVNRKQQLVSFRVMHILWLVCMSLSIWIHECDWSNWGIRGARANGTAIGRISRICGRLS